MTKNRIIVRLTPEVLSIYTTIRISEMMHEVNQFDAQARASHIRESVDRLTKSGALSKEQHRFFHDELAVKSKSFMSRWLDMERRMLNLANYCETTDGRTDKELLSGALGDLGRSGYKVLTHTGREVEINLQGADRKAINTFGLVLLASHEYESFTKSDMIHHRKEIVVNVLTRHPGTYIAVVDALRIAGFGIQGYTPFEAMAKLEITLKSARNSPYRKSIQALGFNSPKAQLSKAA